MKAAQIRAARALIGMKQVELAEKSGISLPTIKRIESAVGPLKIRLGTLTAVQSTLESAGVEFISENGAGVGVRLKKRAE